MRTLVHLSDLHFGSEDPAVLGPLARSVAEAKPHVVLVSGDLTQRARAEQFRAARSFLDALPKPQVVVPGNHDVPLYNVFKRFLAPHAGFRRYISENLEPEFIDEEIAVVGVNTARSLVFKGGRINQKQMERLTALLCPLEDRMAKVVVSHHPFDLPPGMSESQVAGRAQIALGHLARCGADILLAGHLHVSHAGETTPRHPIPGPLPLVVQAGTATSTRERGEPNSFNVLRIAEGEVQVERLGFDAAHGVFAPAKRERFVRGKDGWEKG